MRRPKILVYCGIHKCETFESLVSRFDVCYGFEADPQLAKEAHARYANDRRVHIVHAALAETSGTAILNVHSNPFASSLGRLGDAYRSRTGNKIFPVSQVAVPALNLHDYLASRNVKYIDLYQSDIQGMDFTVLRTLRPMIERFAIKRICCETERDDHEMESYEDLPSNRQSLFKDFLKDGYRIIESQEVQSSWMYQDITWALRPRHLLKWHLRRGFA